MIKCDPDILLYAYEWKLEAPREASDLTNFAHTHSVEADNYMHDQSLHCTSYVSVGPDREYEKKWYVEINTEKLTLMHVYWTKKVTAVSVSLTPSQNKVFHGSTPHISLAKPAGWR